MLSAPIISTREPQFSAITALQIVAHANNLVSIQLLFLTSQFKQKTTLNKPKQLGCQQLKLPSLTAALTDLF